MPLLGPALFMAAGLVCSPLVVGLEIGVLLGVSMAVLCLIRCCVRSPGSLLLVIFGLLGLVRGSPVAALTPPPSSSPQLWELEVLAPDGLLTVGRWRARAEVAYDLGPAAVNPTPRWRGSAPVVLVLPPLPASRVAPQRGERWLFRGRLRAGRILVRDQPDFLRVDSVSHGARLRRARGRGLACLQFWDRMLSRVQRQVRHTINAGAPEPVRGLFLALVLADRSALSGQMTEAFARSGTAHLLAISGLHVVSVALVLVTTARRTIPWMLSHFLPHGARPMSGLLRSGAWWPLVTLAAVCGAAVYVAVASAPVSGLRALLMMALLALGQMLERRASGWNALAGAAFAIAWVNPAVLYQVGFQLSVVSVAGLLALGHRRLRAGRRLWLIRWLDSVIDCAYASVVATLVTAPLCALVWGRVAIAGLWVNLLAVPLLGVFCLPPLLAGSLLGLLHPALATPLLQLASMPASLGLAWVDWAASPVRCPVLLGTPSLRMVIAVYGAVACVGIVVATRRSCRASWS